MRQLVQSKRLRLNFGKEKPLRLFNARKNVNNSDAIIDSFDRGTVPVIFISVYHPDNIASITKCKRAAKLVPFPRIYGIFRLITYHICQLIIKIRCCLSNSSYP
jgi:hypothetical protein